MDPEILADEDPLRVTLSGVGGLLSAARTMHYMMPADAYVAYRCEMETPITATCGIADDGSLKSFLRDLSQSLKQFLRYCKDGLEYGLTLVVNISGLTLSFVINHLGIQAVNVDGDGYSELVDTIREIGQRIRNQNVLLPWSCLPMLWEHYAP